MSEYRVPPPNPLGREFVKEDQRDLERAVRAGKDRSRASAVRRSRRWRWLPRRRRR